MQQINGKADAIFLRTLEANETEIALTIYHDQTTGLVAVMNANGQLLGKVQIERSSNLQNESIAVQNHGAIWSIDAITISKWNGSLPYPYGDSARQAQQTRLDVTGRLVRLDASSRQMSMVDENGKETNFPIQQLATLVPSNGSQEKNTETGDAGIPRVQVTLTDGSQIAGELAVSESGSLAIRPRFGTELIVCPTQRVLAIRKISDAIAALPSAVKRMKLKMDGIELSGQLAELARSEPSTMLRFKPSLAANSVGIRDTGSGTIGPSRPTSTTTASTPELMIQGNIRLFLPGQARGAAQPEDPIVSAFRTPRGLQLRSGDLLDATIESIDETGIRFSSTATSATFMPHDAIQSAQLKIPVRGIPLDVKKMERLLTVPRMRRDNPPTHLLVASNGDYLRGRLKRLTTDTIEFEEGLSTITIPRSTIAVIIWLHDRLWEAAKDESEVKQPESPSDVFQVHVRMRSTGRFTFQPESTDQEKIHGTSPFLGEIYCALSNIESLDFGKNVKEQIASREENAWRLQLAKAPLVFEENDAKGLPMADQLGTGSDMVGKPAPNFELKSIVGKPWRLGNQLGKTIVLDFWASWCGPCMQAMPEVERIVRDLDREDFLWVGINIEESPEKAQFAIDRLNIQSLVLLDEYGSVGTEYDARAIPLTVVIDREGIVRHVFVGGGDETLAGIEKAILSLAEKAAGPSQ